MHSSRTSRFFFDCSQKLHLRAVTLVNDDGKYTYFHFLFQIGATWTVNQIEIAMN